MKAKYIILSLLLLCGAGAATTSCEDMFTPENDLVETDLQPADTLYQMMGIVRSMQKVAEKSILLGEVRADLVDINGFTTTALQELSNNRVSTSNEYNNPQDFYHVINSCNIYLNHVDSLQATMGVRKYKKEIIAAKCFRAWTFLELAKIYGEVPFFTESLITAKDGEDILVDTSNRKNLVEICDFCIDDLKEYALLNENNALVPSYTASFYDISYRYFFIPVRLMLAELYLYRGSFTGNREDFVNAVRMYHDYLAFTNEEITTSSRRSTWIRTTLETISSNYMLNFYLNKDNDFDYRVYVPMDTIAYYGNTTDIRSVFNSQYSNNYYAYVNPSDGYQQLSQKQLNTIYVYNSVTDIDTFYVSQDPSTLSSWTNPERYIGDLRFCTNLITYDISDMYHAEYNTNRQYITKYTNSLSSSVLKTDERMYYLPLYRTSTIYLHFAEALNRMGLPEIAFAVLKYGLSDTVLKDPDKVSAAEYEILQGITSYGMSSNAADWDEDIFRTRDQQSGGNNSSGSAVIVGGKSTNQWGIHCFGSGDAWANKYYYIPTDSTGLQEYPEFNPVDEEGNALKDEALDAYNENYSILCDAVDEANTAYLRSDAVLSARMAAVDKMILDEEALECAYEGTRFYDLMRYSMFNYGNFQAVVNAVAARKGEGTSNPTGTLTSSNVYIPLKTK